MAWAAHDPRRHQLRERLAYLPQQCIDAEVDPGFTTTLTHEAEQHLHQCPAGANPAHCILQVLCSSSSEDDRLLLPYTHKPRTRITSEYRARQDFACPPQHNVALLPSAPPRVFLVVLTHCRNCGGFDNCSRRLANVKCALCKPGATQHHAS
eukprot:1361786-Amphidinium_carterae.2